jgi:hypothetical protein
MRTLFDIATTLLQYHEIDIKNIDLKELEIACKVQQEFKTDREFNRVLILSYILNREAMNAYSGGEDYTRTSIILNDVLERSNSYQQLKGKLENSMRFSNMLNGFVHDVFHIVYYNTGVIPLYLGRTRQNLRIIKLCDKVYKITEFSGYLQQAWVSMEPYKGKYVKETQSKIQRENEGIIHDFLYKWKDDYFIW